MVFNQVNTMCAFNLLILIIVFCLAYVKFIQSNYCFNEADNQVQVTLTLSQPLDINLKIMLNLPNGKSYITLYLYVRT